MLEQVKRETLKLLSFLLSDFGFVSKISARLSGGRGYHIHVRDPRIGSFGESAGRW